MTLSGRTIWQDRWDHLGSFPDSVLVDIARNDAAEHRYRLFAVEVLVSRKSLKVQHPELRWLVKELEIELEGIQFEHPAPSSQGPLVASVTTDVLNGNVIETAHSEPAPEVLSADAAAPKEEQRKAKDPDVS